MKTIKNLYLKHGPFVILFVLVTLASLFVPNFFNINNFQTLLKQWATPVLICIGINFILLIGGVDLSTGYVCGLCSIACGMMLKVLEWHPVVCIILAVCMGALFGVFNGLVVSYLNVPPFITTLGSGYIAYGLAQIISGSRSLNKLPKLFMAIGTTRVIGTIPTMVFFSIFILLVALFLMKKTTYGRNLEYIGNNEQTSRLSGIDVNRLRCTTFACCGMLSGLAGVYLTMRTGSAAPTLGGPTMTFEAITACVLGGTVLGGGCSPIIGGAVGVLILKVIENCINLLNINTYIYDAVLASVVFIAIVTETLKKKNLR